MVWTCDTIDRRQANFLFMFGASVRRSMQDGRLLRRFNDYTCLQYLMSWQIGGGVLAIAWRSALA